MKVILLGLLLALCSAAHADWSPEYVLYQNPIEQNIGPSPLSSAIATDEAGNAHVIYSYLFWRESEPIYLCQGLEYLKFDDHGNLLAGPILITDSTDENVGTAKIRFFNADSFLVMYWGEHFSSEPEYHGFRVQTMHIDGYPLGHWRTFSDTLYWSGFNYAFDVTDDERIVFAFPDTAGAIRMVVEYPNGERLMDHTVVWQQWPCDQVDGFVDDSDSLQLVWRQRTGGDAIYAKRIATNVPFDPSQLSSYVALTPLGHAVPIVRPLGDSLLTFLDGGAEVHYCDYRLRLLDRHTYEETAQVLLGGCSTDPWDNQIGIEPDNSLSLFSGGLTIYDRNLHFKRFTVPQLSLVEDTALIHPAIPGGGIGLRAYAVSEAGARYVLYVKSVAPSVAQLVYRYWRSDLAADQKQPSEPCGFELACSYPNPFNSTTQIRFDLPQPALVNLTIFDVLGRKVEILLNETRPAGSHHVAWNAEKEAAGIYFARMEAGEFVQTQKIMLLK
jgi:hypothetical protein